MPEEMWIRIYEEWANRSENSIGIIYLPDIKSVGDNIKMRAWTGDLNRKDTGFKK